MKDIEELVDLPDPQVQPLVHPIDLPDARPVFRRGWIVRTLADPAVALCVAALVWFASRNVLAPILAAASLVGFGALASRFYLEEAWAFIPRRRQDRNRMLPATWELVPSLLFGIVLAAVLLAIVSRLGQADVPTDVRAFTFGMAVAAALVIVLEFGAKLVLRRDAHRRRTWLTLPGVAAVVASVAIATTVWFESAGAVRSPLVAAGAATMLIIGAVAGIWRHRQMREDRS